MSYRNIPPPKGAPPGTAWFGGPVQLFRVSLGESILTSQDFPGDPDEAILDLLQKVPGGALAFEAVCHVFLDTSNRGFTLPASVMKQLADRKIRLRIQVSDVDEPRRL
jgi:hypothetical protein